MQCAVLAHICIPYCIIYAPTMAPAVILDLVCIVTLQQAVVGRHGGIQGIRVGLVWATYREYNLRGE